MQQFSEVGESQSFHPCTLQFCYVCTVETDWNENIPESSSLKTKPSIHAFYLRARILEYVASYLLTNCKHYLELCSSGIQAANVLMLKMSFVQKCDMHDYVVMLQLCRQQGGYVLVRIQYLEQNLSWNQLDLHRHEQLVMDSIPQLEHLRPHHSVPRLFFCAGSSNRSTWAM